MLLVWENKKLEKAYADDLARSGSVVDVKEAQKENLAVENYGPGFRFVL